MRRAKKKDPVTLPMEFDSPDYRLEVTQVKKITEEIVHYNLVEEDLPVAPDGAIPYELNLAEMPIFSKNKKVKDAQAMRYVFDEKSDEYLRVVPSGDPELLSNKIPQEFDEQIFYGLLKINKQTGKRRIVCDYPTLLKISNLDQQKGRNRIRAKDCLERLTHTAYIFNKCYFDPVAKAMGTDYIKQTKHLHIVSSLETISFDKFQEMRDGEEKEEVRKRFERHGNIEELFVVTLNEDLIKNLELKSFKYFKQEDLLEIDNAVARKLYIMLTKWRYWEKKPIINRRVKFLASRIPLSWNEKSIHSSVQSLIHACEELKANGKIADYVLHNDQGIKTSTIDFCFVKDNLFQVNTVYGIETTGHEQLEIMDVDEEVIDAKPIKVETKPIQPSSSLFGPIEPVADSSSSSQDDVDMLVAILPKGHHEKMTLRNIIVEALKKYDVEYIKRNIMYSNKKANGNYRGYLAKALENDWGLGFQEDQQQAKQERVKIEAAGAAADFRKKTEIEEMQVYWTGLSFDAQTEWLEKAHRKWGDKSQKILMGFALSMAWNARNF